jgi:hypothetical protein
MTEVPKHIEVMARGMYDASPMRQSIGDGPWTVVKWEDAGSGLQEHLIAGVTAAHAALVEAGFVVTPREPTEAMFEKGRKAWKAPRLHVSHTASDEFMTCGVIYRAMIEAAVKP